MAEEENIEEPSRIMFIFNGFNGLLKEFQVQNVSPDQLIYLAGWLDWYSRRAKDISEMKKLQQRAETLVEPQILVPEGTNLPRNLRR